MRRTFRIVGLVALAAVLVPGIVGADVTTQGEIVGTVRGPDGAALVGATVTVAGENLIQREVSQITGDNGAFRFPNLKPGTYHVTINMAGFTPQEYQVNVRVGLTASLAVTLEESKFGGEVLVKGQAPLIDKTSPALATNFNVLELKQLPTSRNFFDTIDATAGFNNRMAYGAGGNVEGYDVFGYGAATNTYQLNGVSTSNLEFGNTWVQPNYDLIQEVQVVGPGSGAEYAAYSGALVNVVTKSGTNEYHGSATAYYTDHNLLSDNSGGILDLEQDNTKYNLELSGTLGGPIVKEKLLFFVSASSNRSENAPPASEIYNDLNKQGYSARLDWLINPSQTVTGMFTAEPIKLENLGLIDIAITGTGPGFYRKQDTYTAYASWLGTWGENTVTEFRYNYVDGDQGRVPNAALDIPSISDYRDGLTYDSQGFRRDQRNRKNEVLGTVTHYVDDFLNGSHEIKAGLDYEDAWTLTDFVSSPNGLMWIIPLGGGLNYLGGLLGYNTHQVNSLKRTGVFAQDKATFGNATITIGVRYDDPTTYDKNTGKALLDFSQWSPRLGLTYDFSGDGRTIARASFGRYYDKVPTYGIGTYAGTGFEPVTYYAYFTSDDLDPTDWQTIHDLLYQPENMTEVFSSQSLPVEAGTKGPHVDVYSAGVDRQIGDNYALTFTYIYRKTTDFIVLTQYANPNFYEPFQYTSDYTGRTFTIYRVTNPEVSREFALGNRDFFYQKSQMAIVQFRRRYVDNLEFAASVTWEHSTGTTDNNECGILSLCSNGRDGDPNWEENPFWLNGSLSQQREWQFKLRGTYQLPAGFQVGMDFRWFSGKPWGGQQYCYEIPGCNDQYYRTVLLEPKDANTTPSGSLLNLRLGKDFNLGGGNYVLSILVDALNVFNEQIDPNTNLRNVVTDIYSRESAERGESVSAYGKPYSLSRGREFRIGARFAF